jgi:hypothetical protein
MSPFRLYRLTADAMLQRLALKKLHDDKGLAFMLADFMSRADVRMVQSRSGTSFAAKAFEWLQIMGDIFG